MDFKEAIKPFTNIPLSRQVLLSLLHGYKRPNDKISELIKSGDLISLKKGLYIAGIKTDLIGPEPFLIANHMGTELCFIGVCAILLGNNSRTGI